MMSNPSYDIDDILNEVKKRREENENKLKGEAPAIDEDKAPAEQKGPLQTAAEPDEVYTEAEEPEEDSIDLNNTADNIEIEQEQSDADEKAQEESFINDSVNDDVTDTSEADSNIEVLESSFEEDEDITVDKDGNVNLFEFSDSTDKKAIKKQKKPAKKWRETKSGKICISIICILLAAIISVSGYGVWAINDALNSITSEDDNSANLEVWSGMSVLEEHFDPIYEDSSRSISSYRQMIKNWYYNGTPASSTHVLNVLLIGEDTRGEEIEEGGTRADSAIIVSVNIDTGEIVLTSILRDCYAYWETVEGDESTGQFGKINGAMTTGINCYINAVEHMLKMNIDNYVIVNFESFETIVDKLGGVTIDVTAAEIKEINNHPKRYGHVTMGTTVGEQLLNGEQALAYCRIRKIDSDSVRADRQKTVLLQLFTKLKGSSTLKSVDIATSLLPYVKTGYKKSEVISIGKYAISKGWLNYSTVTYTVPTNETDVDGSVITTCKGGNYYGAWVWKVDFPLSAQQVQNRVYGKTNIELADSRPKFSTISDY